MWLSEIINQTLCDKFYTKKYIYEFDEMDHDALVDQPAHPPIQQTPPTTLNQPPVQPSPVPPAQQPPPINQQVLNKMQPNHVAMATQQFGQAASQFVQQNPLAAGAIGATAAIGTGLMAKKAIQNSRQ
jgi:hypothetical protein